MLRSRLTLVFKPLIFLSPICISSLCTLPIPLMFRVVFPYLLLSRPSLTRSGFLNGMSEVFEPEALNYYTLSHLILQILSAYRNLIFTHLPLSGSVHFLLCDLIALTTSLAFLLPMTRTPVVVLSFSSSRAYLFLNFLLFLSLRLTLTLILLGSTSH